MHRNCNRSCTLSKRPKIILGGGFLGGPQCPTKSDVRTWTACFDLFGHDTIDTAPEYPVESGESFGYGERILAETGATAWATVDTKILCVGTKRFHSGAAVKRSVEASLAALGFEEGREQVDVMYLHLLDPDVDLEETMEAMNTAYEKGMFKRFGVSNHPPEQVEEMVNIARRNGWVQPTVYQGQYNAICREAERSLFPLLRKYGIAFYAYTPTGAGIFSDNVSSDSIHRPAGRWSHSKPSGKFFSAAYLRPELLEAARKVRVAARRHGIGGHEAALRWVLHHSALRAECGDGIVIGASGLEQLKENLEICEFGPLPKDLVRVFEEVRLLAEPVAPSPWLPAGGGGKKT